MGRVLGDTETHTIILMMGGGQLNFKGNKDAGTATQNLGSFGERFFSKKGGQTVGIVHILANFPCKIQIWTHNIIDNNFEK